jgi:hypothetical protein
MTEQPVETEQEFLGNEEPQAVTITMTVEQPMTLTVPDKDVPLQHYSPGAHLRRPSWSPVDDVELASLARKSAHANRLLAIAKAESLRAEAALQAALDVEYEAEAKVREADEALIAFTRKGTGL